jgi:hypothetical protein
MLLKQIIVTILESYTSMIGTEPTDLELPPLPLSKVVMVKEAWCHKNLVISIFPIET